MLPSLNANRLAEYMFCGFLFTRVLMILALLKLLLSNDLLLPMLLPYTWPTPLTIVLAIFDLDSEGTCLRVELGALKKDAFDLNPISSGFRLLAGRDICLWLKL